MFYVRTVYSDSNQCQTTGVYGGVRKDVEKAKQSAKKLSLARGVAEVIDGSHRVIAAFRSGQEVGSLM